MTRKNFLLMLMLCLLLSACAKEAAEAPPEKSIFEQRLAAIGPYEPAKEPERYYDGSVAEFMPADDYGRVYPYIGQVQTVLPAMYDEQLFYFWPPNNCLYGFVDQNGRIICDPVYRKAELVSYGDKAAYVTRRTVLPRGVDYGDDSDYHYMSMNNSEREEYCAVVSLDGSFVGIYEDVYYPSDNHYYDTETVKAYEYIAVKKDGLWGVIDYDGSEILPCQYYSPPLFSEGLAAVYVDGNEYEYIYIDSTGKQVLGPFEGRVGRNFDRLAFSHGRAISPGDRKYGFIDARGNLVIPHIYTDLYSFKGFDENGLAIVAVGDRDNPQCGIIDINRNYLVPLRETEGLYYYTFAQKLFQEGAYYFFYGELFKYTGGQMVSINEQHEYYGARKCLEGDIFTDYYGIVDIKTDEVYYSADTQYQCCFLGQQGQPIGDNKIIDLDGNPCVIGYLWDWKNDSDDDGNPKPFRFGVLGKNGPVLDFAYDNLHWVGDYFCAVQGEYGGLIKPDGTWFVKVKVNKIDD